MCSGPPCPGSVKGDPVPGSALNRGEDPRVKHIQIQEAYEAVGRGLWKPRLERAQELEVTRNKLAHLALGLLALFMIIGIGSMTWVTLAGKPAAELGNCVEAIATPLFGLVMLVVGYYYGNSSKNTTRQGRD